MKAIALISGGLDSTLAAKLVQQQDIEIFALNFKTLFCRCDRKTANECGNYVFKIATDLGIEVKIINISKEFLDIVKGPRHGYGSHMNPCIDCRILMLKKAKEFMQESGASFIITGEVLGQRPMSQHRQNLTLIEKESGLEGLVLRPLSARLLSETIAEKKGWVDRNKLLDFNGKTRRPQMNLAKNFNINGYPQPAGGCLLTDRQFARRIKDLIKHRELTLDNAELLEIGRHFRISKKTKLIVGRDEKENQRLLNLAKEEDYLFEPLDLKGPVALGRGVFNEALIKFSCSITCRYSDLDGKINADIVFSRVPDTEKKLSKVLPLEENKLKSLRI